MDFEGFVCKLVFSFKSRNRKDTIVINSLLQQEKSKGKTRCYRHVRFKTLGEGTTLGRWTRTQWSWGDIGKPLACQSHLGAAMAGRSGHGHWKCVEIWIRGTLNNGTHSLVLLGFLGCLLLGVCFLDPLAFVHVAHPQPFGLHIRWTNGYN